MTAVTQDWSDFIVKLLHCREHFLKTVFYLYVLEKFSKHEKNNVTGKKMTATKAPCL